MNSRLATITAMFTVSAGLTFAAVSTAVDDRAAAAPGDLTCPSLPTTTNPGNGGGGGNNGNGNGNTTTTGVTTTSTTAPATTTTTEPCPCAENGP